MKTKISPSTIFEPKPILIFTGPRACGKSFLAHQLLKNYEGHEIKRINFTGEGIGQLGLKRKQDYLLKIIHIDEVTRQLDLNFLIGANHLCWEDEDFEAHLVPKPQIIVSSLYEQVIPEELKDKIYQFKISQ